MQLDEATKQRVRSLLKALQLYMLEAIQAERAIRSPDELAQVSEETAADTIYAIDQVAEEAIRTWFSEKWPAELPVEIVMEGLEDGHILTFPEQTPVAQTEFKCIIDPIDGTRVLMYDKRPAWILCGVAPQKFEANTLLDIEVAAMTEIPTTRHWRADCITAVRGGGIEAEAIDVRNDLKTELIELRPSDATEVNHAFGTITRFFPAGLALLSQLEEALWEKLYGTPEGPSPVVFNDQYISTGGQFYEILSGHDRFIADLRPDAFRKLGIEANLCCHPYDVGTALILEEAGCVIEKPDGQPLDYPLDTTTPVSWVAYANKKLADAMRPALRVAIQEHLV